MKSREERELIRATAEIHKQLTDAGLKPQFQVLDNECPLGLKIYTDEMLPKGQYQHSKIISYQHCAAPIKTFQCTYGVAQYHKW